MIKYLFLDIDGVLNGIDYRLSKNYSFNDIDFKCLLYFNEIYKELEYPKIVLISSWRHNPKLINKLNETFKQFYNKREDKEEIKIYDTLDIKHSDKKRPQLVKEYITNNNLKLAERLILDDEYDYEELQHYETHRYSGLENYDVIEIHKKYIK